jgi:hypothetical protein
VFPLDGGVFCSARAPIAADVPLRAIERSLAITGANRFPSSVFLSQHAAKCGAPQHSAARNTRRAGRAQRFGMTGAWRLARIKR